MPTFHAFHALIWAIYNQQCQEIPSTLHLFQGQSFQEMVLGEGSPRSSSQESLILLITSLLTPEVFEILPRHY